MAYTGATTGYAAGAETNTSAVDYALETAYNQAPTGAYQALRYTDFTLDVNETETQPDEINDIPEMAQSVLTGRTTQGDQGGILSAVTYEDLIAGVMGADFSPTNSVTINSTATPPISGGYSIKNQYHSGNDVITGLNFSTFPNVGFVNIQDSQNNINGVYKYINNNNGLEFNPGTFSVPDATKLGDGAKITLANIINGKIGKTFTFRKALSGKWNIFTGTMVNQVQISLAKGQPATVKIDLVGSDMSVSDTDIAASVTPRTTTPLIDTVEGFLGCSIFGKTPAGCIQSATITLSRDGSGQDTGMGHLGACGIRFGSFKAAMEIVYLFRDYAQFLDWQSGKTGPVTVGVQGNDGIGYQFVVLNGIIRNPKTPIPGKNQTVQATVSITANPAPGGGTFGIFRTGN
ncbi:phage tail tube protein [Acetobacter orleanensis]|uniref:Phage tail protein n=1 Tax=Acetobacter orleanensis TaxID=104099 RepID=A0A4Y3TPZ8_9PROT|nr:phage tail tube protein [Acetobacter orleanensis]KXV62546.1 phage tail protein [Acetobacter orleanensis]PCD80014.1 phage tail protein [Acetobacter orleanensis]GAN68328.1 phage minor tail protein [Acetobacter orleanensis JCM 7639]GBR29826.1 hypothetical protein AA0473_2120 [Acetobacter orleanensis NRIC 0473]GEB83858.1 hypothetical protein AOR01nite_23350 [Acetobacter orleanensis]